MKPRRTGSLYRRKGTANWWIKYFVDGKPRYESTKTSDLDAAEQILRDRLHEASMKENAAAPPAELTLGDLLAMVRDNHELNARKSKAPTGRLREFFPADTLAKDITYDRLEAYAAARRKQGAARATIRNELAVLAKGFTLAMKAERVPKRPAFPELTIGNSNARKGFFTDAEVVRVIKQLPTYLRSFVLFAYITGWRRGEIRGLRWSQVDWDAGVVRLETGTTKNNEAREFPFAAHPRLETLVRRQREKADVLERDHRAVLPWVFFHDDGRQVRGWYHTSWRKACDRAGLPGRILHDLRRSAARNLVRAGVSEKVAMTLTGHKTRAVFDRYHIVSGDDQVEAVRRLAASQGADHGDSGDSKRRQIGGSNRDMASPTGFEPVSPP